jgi:hypothetical protein
MSLANPVLGCIGVARIWTLVVWVHHAVPFGPHDLIVFCPCFRLVCEHGRHRWGILIGQNRAQHPDLGFHVGVLLAGAMVARWLEHLRWRITLSSHKAKPAKAGMAIPGDDDVIMDSDAEQLANLVNLLGHVDIGPGRGGVTGRVVVHEDAAGSM